MQVGRADDYAPSRVWYERPPHFKDFDFDGGKVTLPSGTYELTTTDFPTVDRKDPYRLSEGEERLLNEIKREFLNSERLQRHMRFSTATGLLTVHTTGTSSFMEVFR